MTHPTQPRLARSLRKFDLFAISFGSIVGVGWLIRSANWLERGGPIGSSIAFLGCTLFLVPVALSYGFLIEKFQDAEAETAYLRGNLPRQIQFIAGWSITLAYLVVCPWEAIAIGELLGKLAPSLQDSVLIKTIAGVSILLFVWGLNWIGIRSSALFQRFCVYLLLFIFGALIYLGITRGSPTNVTPLFATDVSAWKGIIRMLQVVPYFLMGFEVSARTSEELRDDDSPKSLTPILSSLGLGGIFYTGIILLCAYLVPWTSLKGQDFATLVAFKSVTGSSLLGLALLVAALFSLAKVLNGNFVASSRMVYALSRSQFLNSQLSKISASNKTPVAAATFVVAISIVGMFFGKKGLDTLSELGSFAISVAWLFASTACWIHARNGNLSRPKLAMASGLLGIVVSLALILMQVLWFMPGHLTLTHVWVLALWLAFGFFLRPRQK